MNNQVNPGFEYLGEKIERLEKENKAFKNRIKFLEDLVYYVEERLYNTQEVVGLAKFKKTRKPEVKI